MPASAVGAVGGGDGDCGAGGGCRMDRQTLQLFNDPGFMNVQEGQAMVVSAAFDTTPHSRHLKDGDD